MFRVNLSSFNHLDFLWGRDARTLVYSKIQSLMGEYSHSVPAPITLHRDASKTDETNNMKYSEYKRKVRQAQMREEERRKEIEGPTYGAGEF
ncbi:hypothetical protein J6590_092467 [Homalodisca vitripennis]|nr:hypothetical protein J6590_092467 [Homalodisca vitripennis]